jgi:chromosome condensin MukBEF ATPase and DNA-binding subunit MukB
MERLAEQMREAAQAGDMDAARDKMAELEQMLDELKNVRPEHGRMTEREHQRAQQRQRGQQQMNALQDVVQRLGTLLDRAENREPPLGRGLRRP